MHSRETTANNTRPDMHKGQLGSRQHTDLGKANKHKGQLDSRQQTDLGESVEDTANGGGVKEADGGQAQ